MERCANGFQRYGVSSGCKVCVNVSNSAESFVAVYSLCCLGAAVLLIKPALPEREVMYLVEDSGAKFILTEQQNAAKILNIHKVHQFKALFSTNHAKGFLCVQDFESEDGGQFQEPRIEDTKNHISLYTYTTGTTGLPKGAEISMYAFNASAELCRAAEFFNEGDVLLGWNPVTHASGFILTMAAFITGAMVVPSRGQLSAKEFVNVVNKHQVTSLCTFPTAFRKLVFQLEEGAVPSLKRIIMCGTVFTEDVYQRTLQVLQLESLRNAYGLSEVIGFITITAPNTIGYRSAGYPLPMVEYKIVDIVTGGQLGPGEVGEIYFRAPQVMRGYYNRPEATAQVLDPQRWFRSGDAGYYDGSGKLYVVERLKDMIKCLDQQVAPAEIETILMKHPLVLEAAVVGINHPDLGEAPTAFVVIDPSTRGRIDSEDLVRLVAEQTAFHKNLHGGVFFVNQIPKSETGKYLRRKLRSGHLRFTGKAPDAP
nr:luciferin 4-monooxygenase-like [Dermacentor andersoni]